MARPSGSEDDGGALELVLVGDIDAATEDNALEVSLVHPAANRRAQQMSAPLRMSLRRVMYV